MGNNFIVNDQNPNSPNREILDLILEGEANAKTGSDLASALHTDPREIRKMVERARIDGNIIAGNDNGYFIPTCYAELNAYLKRTFSQIVSSACAMDPAFRFTGKHIRISLEEWKNE